VLSIRITSYVNNLHPIKHKNLYHIIEKIITASIPLWNKTLAPLAHLWYHKNRAEYIVSRYVLQPDEKLSDKREVILRIPYYDVEYDPDPEHAPETEGPQRLEGEDDKWSRSYWDRRNQWIEDTRKVVLPEPGAFRPLEDPPPFDLRKEFGGTGLQVIVKLANIELTAEKPEYGGGTWHVEGQLVRCILHGPYRQYLSLQPSCRMNISALQHFTITRRQTSHPHLSRFANTPATSRAAGSCTDKTSTNGSLTYSGVTNTGRRSKTLES
jgi:hypothetical protein